MKDWVSKCCGKPVKIGGRGDGSHWWECAGCGQAADLIHFKKFKPAPASAPKAFTPSAQYP